jgi:hypothetical protein
MPLPDDRNVHGWQRYAGLTIQFLGSIGLAVWLGLKLDHWLLWGIPVLIWLLPLLVITGMIFSIIRNHSKK